MKKLLSLISVLTLALTLSACSDYAQNALEACTGNDDTETGTENQTPQVSEDLVMFNHIAGHGAETPEPIHILFEYESLKYTKYQIAYQSCT